LSLPVQKQLLFMRSIVKAVTGLVTLKW